jgi:3-oxoadipate enol-lactonase
MAQIDLPVRRRPAIPSEQHRAAASPSGPGAAETRNPSPATHPELAQLLAGRPWLHTVQQRRVVAADGTGIAYQAVGQGERLLLLANGLGGRLYAWLPLIDRFWRDYRLVTWDYRGLFDSSTPPRQRMLAIPNHVIDAHAILDAEGADDAVVFGWSMGVQVALELAVTHPEHVAGLVLLNGTHGHALSSALQPLLPMPGVRTIAHRIIELLQSRPVTLDTMARVARAGTPLVARAIARAVKRDHGELAPLLAQYTEDVMGPSFDNYLYLFQELDAHSVYHALPAIAAPTLLISGLFDVLTPARQSFDMARRLPRAEHLVLRRAGHFALLEQPEIVLPAIDEYLARVG